MDNKTKKDISFALTRSIYMLIFGFIIGIIIIAQYKLRYDDMMFFLLAISLYFTTAIYITTDIMIGKEYGVKL